jgi:hypothetical protein
VYPFDLIPPLIPVGFHRLFNQTLGYTALPKLGTDAYGTVPFTHTVFNIGFGKSRIALQPGLIQAVKNLGYLILWIASGGEFPR